MADRDPTNQATVLTAVVDRLIAQITEATELTCFATVKPFELSTPPADIYFQVSPVGGEMDGGAMDGAGRAIVREDAAVRVTVISGVQLDEVGRDPQVLTHATLGLLDMKRQVLDALTIHDLLDPGDSDELLVQPMRPISSEDPQTPVRGVGMVSVVFETLFKWSMS